MNYAKTFVLISALTALFGFIGFIVAGTGGMMIALVIAGAMNLFAYWNSGSSVLNYFKAKPVDKMQTLWLYDMVEQLARNANMPMPKIYIMDNPQPNAFATGRDPQNGVVAVTTGIIDILNKDELAGVIAHELAHIQNRDTLIMTITATIAGAISTIANLAMFANIFGGGHSSSNEEGENNNMNPLVMVLVSMLAPIAASVVQMTISRTREYEADKIGAKICGNPMALANALAKIEQSVRGYGIHNEPAENNQAMAHLFIINPLFGKKSDSLFSTHPDTQNRIAALQELARSGDFTNKSYSENRQSALRSSGDVHEKKSPWE